MEKNKAKKNRILKWKMIFFKIHFIFIYIVFRPKRYFLNIEAKKKYRKTKTPLILAYNHVGYYDGLTIWCSFVCRNIRFISIEEISTKRISHFFFNWNGLILIDKHLFSLNDYRKIVEAINSGFSLGIAPEGQINREIAFKPFQVGTAKFAKSTKTDILPLYFLPNRKKFFRRQHIFVGDIIDIEQFEDSNSLTIHLKETMEQLRYNSFFNNKSHVFILPLDYNIKEEEVRFKFYQKYNEFDAANQYKASKSAWYFLDKILEKHFGLILNPNDIKFDNNGKPYHKDIKFNISHSEELIAIIVSKEECSIDIQQGYNYEIKTWTKEEAILKFSQDIKYKLKTKKIKHNENLYALSFITSGKVYYYRKI